MKQIYDTKILRGKPSQEFTNPITCFAKLKHFLRILLPINDEMETTRY